jgi:ADP-heptose:LPS heptosyltransferase
MVLPELGVAELVAGLSLVDAFVASSTGPLHVAAIVSGFALGLYSETRHGPELWRPIGTHGSLVVAPWKFSEPPDIDSPLADEHMAEITVDAVVAQMLAGASQRRHAA